MTIGPENPGNGTATAQERFAGPLAAYRGARRDGGGPVDGAMEVELGAPRNGAAVAPSLQAPSLQAASLQAASLPGPPLQAPPLQAPSLPSLDLDGLSEPVYPPSGWLDGPAASLADHPLLRGLLLELPPKGTMPAAGWLDRWFEAARSILELLYVQESRQP